MTRFLIILKILMLVSGIILFLTLIIGAYLNSRQYDPARHVPRAPQIQTPCTTLVSDPAGVC